MGAVQQYVDLYRSQKDLINGHSSAVMNGLREEAVSLLESRGLPSLKDEEHRRTDIESVYSPDYGLNLGRIDIETNPYEVFRCDVPNLSTLLYFVVNDSFYKRVQPVSSKLPDGVLVGSLCGMSRPNCWCAITRTRPPLNFCRRKFARYSWTTTLCSTTTI